MSGQSAAHGTLTSRCSRQVDLALLTAVALLPSLAACASAPGLPWCPPGQRVPAQQGGYELGPGDRLLVTVFRHERLSGEFTLDPAGSVALPLVGAVFGDGLTPRELEVAIEDELREQRYLVDPDVSIQVLTHRPFYILGEVAQPGEYEYVSGMTLVNAVALAGGYTHRADRSGVTVSRGHCVREATAAARLLPGAIVRVPPRFF
jgi:protein involved in polysaccharide export with SLBB domain